jgi:hypothetical protein
MASPSASRAVPLHIKVKAQTPASEVFTFTPRTNKIRDDMPTAQVYLEENAFERLAKPWLGSEAKSLASPRHSRRGSTSSLPLSSSAATGTPTRRRSLSGDFGAAAARSQPNSGSSTPRGNGNGNGASHQRRHSLGSSNPVDFTEFLARQREREERKKLNLEALRAAEDKKGISYSIVLVTYLLLASDHVNYAGAFPG